MLIRITEAPAVHPSHGLTAGRVFEVLGPGPDADPLPGMERTRRTRGWYVMGERGERVLVLHGEYELVTALTGPAPLTLPEPPGMTLS